MQKLDSGFLISPILRFRFIFCEVVKPDPTIFFFIGCPPCSSDPISAVGSPCIEIIIIDDHSSDNSLNEIRKVNGYNKFKIIRHLTNSGYGNAIITGMHYATGDVIVSMDTDGQHSPSDIFSLIKPIFDGEADYTIGSRYLGTYHYRLPIATRLGEVLIEKFIPDISARLPYSALGKLTFSATTFN